MTNSGKNKLFYSVLEKAGIEILDKLPVFKNDFYLAGGTALALQLGHRISVDFDFFTSKQFDNEKLINLIKTVFDGLKISFIQNERDTLTFLLNSIIKISLFKLPYNNALPLIKTEYFNLAQIKEIGVMKLLALFRATYKDYVDIYYILKKHKLAELLTIAEEKHPEFDKAIYLRALLSYGDVDEFPIVFASGFEVDRSNVFNFIERKAVEYLKETE